MVFHVMDGDRCPTFASDEGGSMCGVKGVSSSVLVAARHSPRCTASDALELL
jgi:hypothetical protein